MVKSEVFRTEGGIEGMRAYGNMALENKITKKGSRMYYEYYFFKQQNGLQTIFIMHREGDEYAPQILDRIKNSIEITKPN